MTNNNNIFISFIKNNNKEKRSFIYRDNTLNFKSFNLEYNKKRILLNKIISK